MDIDELRARAEALGVKVDRRWGVDRLKAAIADAQPVDELAGDDLADELEHDQADELAGDDEHDQADGDPPGTPGGDEPAGGGSMGDSGGHTDADELDELAELDTPTPIRHGGHVNHGDGRGWVLDSEE